MIFWRGVVCITNHFDPEMSFDIKLTDQSTGKAVAFCNSRNCSVGTLLLWQHTKGCISFRGNQFNSVPTGSSALSN